MKPESSAWDSVHCVLWENASMYFFHQQWLNSMEWQKWSDQTLIHVTGIIMGLSHLSAKEHLPKTAGSL